MSDEQQDVEMADDDAAAVASSGSAHNPALSDLDYLKSKQVTDFEENDDGDDGDDAGEPTSERKHSKVKQASGSRKRKREAEDDTEDAEAQEYAAEGDEPETEGQVQADEQLDVDGDTVMGEAAVDQSEADPDPVESDPERKQQRVKSKRGADDIDELFAGKLTSKPSSSNASSAGATSRSSGSSASSSSPPSSSSSSWSAPMDDTEGLFACCCCGVISELPADVTESGRLFVRNLPYSITEDQLTVSPHWPRADSETLPSDSVQALRGAVRGRLLCSTIA